jgi:2-aminoethylphosphonate-pyruvate transaminase
MSDRDSPLLLTPGPLTTAASTRDAMSRDWGSRDRAFIDLNARVRGALVGIAEAAETHVCVPVQGSGTFAIEATLGTVIPRDGKLLALVNGAYGKRIAKICAVAAIPCTTRDWKETDPVAPAAVAAALAGQPDVTHVAVVHCETTTGILNPIEEIADVVAAAGRSLVIDAMSTFGAIPLSAREVPFDAVVASSNKCLEGAPGVGFAILRRKALQSAQGNARSLSLDLYEQWQGFERNGQWRFTPPTHVMAALDCAIELHTAEGGARGRGARYRANCKILVEGMRRLGFETVLPDALQAPIIVTFRTPRDPSFEFETFYDRLARRGFVIYPGKLTELDTFRIGCIGQVTPDDMRAAVAAVRDTLNEMGVTECAP